MADPGAEATIQWYEDEQARLHAETVRLAESLRFAEGTIREQDQQIARLTAERNEAREEARRMGALNDRYAAIIVKCADDGRIFDWRLGTNPDGSPIFGRSLSLRAIILSARTERDTPDESYDESSDAVTGAGDK